MRPTWEERQARATRVGLPPSMFGRIEGAHPVVPVGKGEVVPSANATGGEVAHFYQRGPVGLSPANVGAHVFFSDVGELLVILTLSAAGTSNTVITLYKNGVSIGTVTLASGATLVTKVFTASFVALTDKLTAKVTTLGTGTPQDLTMEAQAA